MICIMTQQLKLVISICNDFPGTIHPYDGVAVPEQAGH